MDEATGAAATGDPTDRSDATPARPATTGPRWGAAGIGILTLAGLLIVVFGLQKIANIVMPAFLALNLAIAAQPLGRALEKRGAPRWLASLATLLVLYLVLAAMVGALVWSAYAAADEAPAYAGQLTKYYNDVLDFLSRFGYTTDRLQSTLTGIDPNSILSTVQSVASSLSSAGSQLMILVLAITFFAFDLPGVARRAGLVAEHRPHLAAALGSFASSIRSYWIVSTVFGLIVAVVDVVALWALGVPLAFVWGVLAFITNYIPNIGFVLGVVPPALFGLFTGGPATALWTVAAYCVINFVIQSLIQPKFTGDAVGLTASVTFLSLVFWSSVAGSLGAILAVPLTLAVKAAFVDADPSMRWLDAFLTTAGRDDRAASRTTGAAPEAKPQDGAG